MSAAGDKIKSLFDGHIKINLKSSFANSFIQDNLPVGHLLKIGLLLFLCFSSFMIKFHYHKKEMKYNTSKAALEYDKTQDANKAVEENKQYVNDNGIDKIKKAEFTDKDLK